MCAYHKAKYRDYKLKLKLEVLEAYGGAVCAVCGETDLDLLQLDHVEGGGRQHRRELDTSGGYEFYLRLKSDGFPQIPPMQVLCANHNIKAYADGRRG